MATGGLDFPNVSRLEMQFKPPAHLAAHLPAAHMTASQAGPTGSMTPWRQSSVLIIGASRGIGLEAVKAALEAGHSVRALARSARGGMDY
jgi:NADPH:quinone reductase-like Zn-dependent oxidoreductase